MNIKNIIKKYKIIILLVAIIFILAFIKMGLGDETDNENISNLEITPTTTIDQKINNNYSSNKTNDEVKKEYDNLATDEEKDQFLNTLTASQQNYVSGEESPEEYDLETLLPYEEETFIAKRYATANVLVVKEKGDDFTKSKSDVEKWLDETADNPGEIILVWED